MSEKERILQRLHAIKGEIFGRYHIRSLALFGSVARGEERGDSDVDLLVEFDTTPDLLTFIALEERIKEAVERRVDLVPARKLRPELSQRIKGESIAV